MPQAEFEKPRGGFFVWVNLPEGTDTQVLRARLAEHNVDFIHGARFFTDGRTSRAFRVAFSLYSPDELRLAAQRIGAAIGT